MTTTYTYASGNLLDTRNTYTYTKYHGARFFKDWRKNRDTALAQLPAPIPAPPAKSVRTLEIISADKIYKTAELIEALFAKVIQGGLDQFCYRVFAQLVQRFEVTKRIHEEYSTGWRAIDKAAYSNMYLYVRYAELMQAVYKSTMQLEYLNVFLKVLDTLVALMDQLSPDEAARLASLLLAEQDFINEISGLPR